MQPLNFYFMPNTPKGTKTIALNNLCNTTAALMDKQQELKMKREIFDRSQRSLINEIDNLKEEIKAHSFLLKYGWLYVGVSSTDCDCVQMYYVRKFQSLKRFKKFSQSVYENAEGATYISIITKADYDLEREHPTRSRDRIMEAYENGNGRSIIV